MSPKTRRRTFLKRAFVVGLGGATICVVQAQVAEAKLPTIWEEILQATRAVLGDPDRPSDPFELSKKLPARAQEIAQRYGRADVEALYRSVDAAVEQCRDVDERLYSGHLAELVLAEIVDPADELGYKRVLQWWSHSAVVGSSALAAVDSYHDARSRAFLLDVALDEGRLAESGFLAVQLLRGYGSAEVQEKLSAALQAEQALPQNIPEHELLKRRARESILKGAIASLVYAGRITDPDRRESFLKFETRLWRARAIGPTGFRGWSQQFYEAARIAERGWRNGDEESVVRIFEDPLSLDDELRMASSLLHRISDEDRKRIDAVAHGNSRTAEFARQAMRLWELRSKSPINLEAYQKLFR